MYRELEGRFRRKFRIFCEELVLRLEGKSWILLFVGFFLGKGVVV